jgi:uncharacterized protein
MARTVRWLIAVVLLVVPGLFLSAETVKQLPAPTGYVNDFAGVLSPDTKLSLEELCAEVDRDAHAQIAVVTVKTIEDDKGGETSLEEFTTELEEKWKVGKKGTDRGVVMLFVTGPTKGRIEVGYGLEGILNDAKVGDIGRSMSALAHQGDYDQAIPIGVRAIAQVIATDAGVTLDALPAVHHYHREGQVRSQMPTWGVLVIGVLVVAVFLILIATGHAGMAFWLLFNLIGGGGGGGGRDDDRGGGGGFGGFGGGSSGGGGASGDW